MNTESDMMHGKMWEGQDLRGWLLMEKFDGCRILWDGERAWTRAGRLVELPEHWAAALPELRIDAEVWGGYGGFQLARDAVMHGRFDPALRLVTFDVNMVGTYHLRLGILGRVLGHLPAGCVPGSVVCRSNEHALEEMEKVMARGGEGVIARDPANIYEPGRTGDILKLKMPRREMWFLKTKMKGNQ